MNSIGIIVPVYNVKENYLRECVDSLLSQTYKNIHIYIIDDKSQAWCANICDEFEKSDERVTVIHHGKNKGLPGARNTGIEHCNEDWISFVDGDDWVDKDMCERFVRFLTESGNNPDIYIFSGYRSYPGHEEGNKNDTEVREYLSREDINQLQVDALTTFLVGKPDNTVPFDSAWAKFFRGSFLKEGKIVFRDLPFREDGLFFQEVTEKASSVVYSPELLYHYRMCKNSMVNVYRKNHPEELEKYLGYLWDFSVKNNKGEAYNQALYGAAFFAMQTAITNYFYNSQCPLRKKDRKKACAKFFALKFFDGVFETFQEKEVKRNHRIKLIMLKHKWYGGVQLFRRLYLQFRKRECYD